MGHISFRIISGILLMVCLMLCSEGVSRLIAASVPELRPVKILQDVSSLVFSADGTTMALGGAAIRLWDVATLTERSVLPLPGERPVFNSDGHFLAVPGYPIRVWDLRAEHEVSVPIVGTPQFSSDGSLLTGFNCYGDGSNDTQRANYSWDLLLGGLVDSAQCSTQSITSGFLSDNIGIPLGYFALNPDKTLQAMSTYISLHPQVPDSTNISSYLYIVDTKTNNLLATLPSYLGAVGFSSDGKTLAVVDISPLSDTSKAPSQKIHVFDVATWQEIAILDGVPLNTTLNPANLSIKFSPDNQFLACVCRDDIAILWKLDSVIPTIKLTPQLALVSLPTDPAQRKQFLLDRLARYGTVVEDSDGKSVVIVNWASLWHYRLDESLIPPQPIFQGDPMITSGGIGLRGATVTADKTILIAQYGYGPLMAWDIATGAQLYTLSTHGSIWTLSPDGEHVVAISANEWDGYVWNTRTGQEIASWWLTQDESQDDRSKRGILEKIVFSPDGKVVALSSIFYEGGPGYNQLRLLQFPSGRKLALYTLDGGVRDANVAFSRDGRTVTYAHQTWEVPSE